MSLYLNAVHICVHMQSNVDCRLTRETMEISDSAHIRKTKELLGKTHQLRDSWLPFLNIIPTQRLNFSRKTYLVGRDILSHDI